MALESKEPKKEISDAEWEQLKKDAEYYRGLIREKTKNASRSANHILRNLSFHFHPDLIKDAESKGDRVEIYKTATEGINYVKRYFKLLEDFPEFAEKELKPGGGYFSELMNTLAGNKEFVNEYEKKLRGKLTN